MWDKKKPDTTDADHGAPEPQPITATTAAPSPCRFGRRNPHHAERRLAKR